MNAQFDEALEQLPAYLGGHVAVSVTALLIGLASSLPLALASLRRPALRGVLLGFASVVQTVPSLALLALFYPLLLGAAALCEHLLGASFSALGFLPSVLALTLYSMLPVLRNTVTGLAGIDPAINEAALGVGMTRRQARWMVELPLALPVIMAGIRTAAIWVIGAATLSTPIGQTSLGNYIFTGLQTQNWVFVLFGCTAAAAFALVVDQLLALVESGLTRRKRSRVAFGALALVAIIGAALAPPFAQSRAAYAIGAKPFTEQYVLAALIEQRLGEAGRTAATREGLGSAIIFNALSSGEIDAYVDYSGTLWTNQMHRSEVKPRAEVLAELKAWLSMHGIVMLGGLGFENAYALAIPRGKAASLGIRSIADLAARAPALSIAGDYEFFGRPEWAALRGAYGLNFREQRQMQPEFMYAAAANGEVNVIAAYTSDGRIAQFDLAVLDDPKAAIPPYDAVLLLSAKRAHDETFVAALQPLIGAIDIKLIREANRRASESGASPAEAARWLSSEVRKTTARRR
jgi:osmoprotectant transport system substrate-binding protein/osmoprotectant transport system permease protein